jgi:hypothetical protein
MNEDILVVKKKGNSQLKVKVTKRAKNRHREALYNNVINIKDYKALATFLSDLEVIFGAPIEKAMREKKKNKNPFW